MALWQCLFPIQASQRVPVKVQSEFADGAMILVTHFCSLAEQIGCEKMRSGFIRLTIDSSNCLMNTNAVPAVIWFRIEMFHILEETRFVNIGKPFGYQIKH